MTILQILDTKDFMSKLLVKDTFDDFLLVKADICTSVSTSIDGRINKDFFDDTEIIPEEYPKWSNLKPLCFEIIKGKVLPLSVKIILKLPKESLEDFLSKAGIPERKGEIQGLFINIHFDKNNLKVVTGTSLKTFSIDKTIEFEWDKWVKNFMFNEKIENEEA
ncbi:hypothetical protein SAMN05216249_1173 [Acetitomaculum ruminis DSM 5522]|uniref:Uncharacterized protein n=1 Tax=Acetitomaculum ruminis DSM 5522 TaxID=1120918 RepID=A0A1I0ZRK3_9FIRM|nr:DUF5721 family protein [Acetitomaculum ruminis]SFB27992.1 hypothetical protein SAMN05216249_1173 [Acetitomaculum ruminis DSM 5522]